MRNPAKIAQGLEDMAAENLAEAADYASRLAGHAMQVTGSLEGGRPCRAADISKIRGLAATVEACVNAAMLRRKIAREILGGDIDVE